MQTITHIKDLHKANAWAMELVFDVLPAEYLDEPINTSFPNIKAILLHIWSAQAIWYNRITGTNAIALPAKNYEGRFADLKESVLNSHKVFVDLLEDKTDTFLNAELKYSTTKGAVYTQPNYTVLLQLTHHGAFHRGQIIAFMRQLGFTNTIPQTDLIAWYRLKM